MTRDERFEEFRRQLRERHAGVVPDAGFAARVTAHLPRRGETVFAWAAWRVLPVSAALIVALLIAVAVTPATSTASAATASMASIATSSESDDVVSWVLDQGTAR